MSTPHAPHHQRDTGHPRMALLLLVVAAVAFGGWGAWRSFGPQPANAGERLRDQTQRLRKRKGEVAGPTWCTAFNNQ